MSGKDYDKKRNIFLKKACRLPWQVDGMNVFRYNTNLKKMPEGVFGEQNVAFCRSVRISPKKPVRGMLTERVIFAIILLRLGA